MAINAAELMRQAIALAMRGRGLVEPNPMVGCIIVKDGKIVATGYHERFGGPHAEPNALAACAAAGASPAGATLYVTLEPCCHIAKKTPPCTPMLIASGVARVVIGCLDPNPLVSGNGVAMLRSAGIEVVVPVLEPEARQLIAPFLLRVRDHRPYVTLKWAESADGKVAGPEGRPIQISNASSSRVVHGLRSRCDAIAVGVNTVLQDDPMLTVRGVPPLRTPRRIVLDTHLRMPIDCRLVRTARDVPLLILTSVLDVRTEPFLRAGAEVRAAPLDAQGRLSLSDVVRCIGADVTHLLVEPGPTLARSFMEAGLADRVWVFRSRLEIRDNSAPSAVTLPARFVETGSIDMNGDRLTEYLDRDNRAYFANEQSSDFQYGRESPAAWNGSEAADGNAAV